MKKRYVFMFFAAVVVLMNACQKEYSFESGFGASAGSLQDDGSGDCLPKTVSGAYVVGTSLTAANNYIDVVVNVTTPGNYIVYTDTVDGMLFRGSGIFSTAGLDTVRIR